MIRSSFCRESAASISYYVGRSIRALCTSSKTQHISELCCCKMNSLGTNCVLQKTIEDVQHKKSQLLGIHDIWKQKTHSSHGITILLHKETNNLAGWLMCFTIRWTFYAIHKVCSTAISCFSITLMHEFFSTVNLPLSTRWSLFKQVPYSDVTRGKVSWILS